MSDTFNDKTRNELFKSNDFNGLYENIKTSLKEMKEFDKDLIADAHTYSNVMKSLNNEMLNVLGVNIKSIENTSLGSMKNLNTETVNNYVNTTEGQNKQSMTVFMETYLFLIIKVICLLLLVYLAYRINSSTITSFSFSGFGLGLNKLYQESSTTVQNGMKRINNAKKKIDNKALKENKNAMNDIKRSQRSQRAMNVFDLNTVNNINMNSNRKIATVSTPYATPKATPMRPLSRATSSSRPATPAQSVSSQNPYSTSNQAS
jgi:hypothetical protein